MVWSLRDVAFVGRIQQRAYVVAADLTIRDRHVLGRARKAQRVGTLKHDGVVVRRVDAAIRDAHVATGINIEAGGVGIDREIVDRQIVYAGRKQGEVSAVQDREVAQQYVTAEFQADGLVAQTVHHLRRVALAQRRLRASARLAAAQSGRRIAGLKGTTRARAATCQPLAVDETGAEDGDVFKPHAPDETVAPVAMTEVLVHVPLVRLRQVISAFGFLRVGGENRRALV